MCDMLEDSGLQIIRLWGPKVGNLEKALKQGSMGGGGLRMYIYISIYIYIFSGLRPLAGYASLKLYVSCAVISLVRLIMLPAPTPDDAGDASFLGPSRAPTQKADMGSRACAPKAPKRAAQKEQPASQPGNAKHRK